MGLLMLVESTNIVGANEIAERLGMSFPNIIHAWRVRNIGFPEPTIIVSAGMLWEWNKVEEWYNNRKSEAK